MKLICFCGIDGSGKSTIINSLQNSNYNANIIFKAFNYRTNVNSFQVANPSIDVTNIDNYSTKLKTAFLKAFLKDFAQYYEIEIIPLINSNKIVISDRWFHCVASFAMALNVEDKEMIKQFQNYPPGNLIFYLDVSPKIAFARQTIAADNYYKSLKLLKEYANGYDRYFALNKYELIKVTNDNLPTTISVLWDHINLLAMQ